MKAARHPGAAGGVPAEFPSGSGETGISGCEAENYELDPPGRILDNPSFIPNGTMAIQ